MSKRSKKPKKVSSVLSFPCPRIAKDVNSGYVRSIDLDRKWSNAARSASNKGDASEALVVTAA